ncbi:tol-pal system-associated acyl-CoA thioesterase [Rickettsiales bacterium]|nr:tol-pal system-associated acyl-CoA thioesterase [Rickettsiales bacterium]
MNINFRIYTEDTDWGGMVYHSNYLKFYERARSDFLRQSNINQIDLKNNFNINFVVSSMEIKFIKPATMDDLITVNTKINAIKKASIILEQEIYNNDLLLNKAKVILAIINSKNKKPVKVPEIIIKAFSK